MVPPALDILKTNFTYSVVSSITDASYTYSKSASTITISSTNGYSITSINISVCQGVTTIASQDDVHYYLDQSTAAAKKQVNIYFAIAFANGTNKTLIIRFTTLTMVNSTFYIDKISDWVYRVMIYPVKSTSYNYNSIYGPIITNEEALDSVGSGGAAEEDRCLVYGGSSWSKWFYTTTQGESCRFKLVDYPSLNYTENRVIRYADVSSTYEYQSS